MHVFSYDTSCEPTFDCLPDRLWEIQEYASSEELGLLVGEHCLMLSVEVFMAVVVKVVTLCSFFVWSLISMKES
jgi:hypothetical protein